MTPVVERFQLSVTITDTDSRLGDRRDTIFLDVTPPITAAQVTSLRQQAVAEYQRRTQAIKDQMDAPKLPPPAVDPAQSRRDALATAKDALAQAQTAVQASLDAS